MGEGHASPSEVGGAAETAVNVQSEFAVPWPAGVTLKLSDWQKAAAATKSIETVSVAFGINERVSDFFIRNFTIPG